MQMSPDALPDFHFLLIADNLGAEWLFDAARHYWERYRPTIISNFDLVRLVPAEYTVSVTVVALRDRNAQLGVELAQAVPRALFDPIVTNTFEETRTILVARADLNQPFGVPLIPTATPPPIPTSPPLYPTPGPIQAIPVTPGTAAPVAPTLAPALPTVETTSAPVYPTPGAITGG